MAEKSELSRTMWETWQATSLPEAMAMEPVCRFQGKDVVNTVTRHGNCVSGLAHRTDKFTFLFRGDPAEDGILVCRVADCLRGCSVCVHLWLSRHRGFPHAGPLR